MKIRKGDTVEVIAGKDRGTPGNPTRGKVLAVLPREGKVIVEGVNRVKRHTRVRQTQRGSKTGGIVTQEAAIDVSNVMLVDPDGKRTRVGYRIDESGQKIRVARTTGKDLPQ